MTTKINSGTKRTERRYAEVVGEMRPVGQRQDGDRDAVTLGDLQAFLMAAQAGEVPLDTPVKIPSAFGFGMQTLTRLVVDVQVEVEG